MSILYDHQIFSIQKYGGISRYFFELINHLPEEISYKLPLLFSANHYIADNEISGHINFFKNSDFRGQIRMMKTMNQFNAIRYIKFSKYDLFHPTYYAPYFLKHIGNKPFVVTCLDLTLERFSDRFPGLSRDKESLLYKGMVMKKASKIIAISESTKRDIVEIYGIPEQKIEVVYLASSLKRHSSERMIQQNYILFIGARNFYKNFIFFLESVSDILLENPGLTLICAGGGRFTQEEETRISELGVFKQVRQVPANDEVMENLYTHALFFVFPSLYEGFGIPVLEAFSCGCPALISNTSSLPEVGGDAALYFDPSEKDSINETVRKAIKSKEILLQMTDKGQQQLKAFSWERTAAETAEIYKSVINR